MKAVKSSNPKRASARIDVTYDAMLISSDGHEFQVVVKDLSAEGFRIQIGDEIRAGEQVFLRTKRDGDIPAEIVWVMGTEAGGTFLAKSHIPSNDTTSRAVDEPAPRRPIHPSWSARAALKNRA